jgi:hypothetical protein
VTPSNRLAAAALAALLPALPVLAEVRGVVHEVVNPESPRAEWRRQPVAGAYVAMTWSVVAPAPAHATDSCRHAEIARTDANGQYAMQGPGFITAGLAKPRVLAHLPGREQVAFPYPGSPSSPADITLGRPARSADDRLQILLMLENPGCSGREVSDPQGILKAYFESLAGEADALRPETEAGRNTQRYLQARAKRAPSSR